MLRWVLKDRCGLKMVICVNTATGAGDVFHGALSVALAEKMPTKEAIRFASAVAAMKCTQPGGRAGIPNREQTESFLSLYA